LPNQSSLVINSNAGKLLCLAFYTLSLHLPKNIKAKVCTIQWQDVSCIDSAKLHPSACLTISLWVVHGENAACQRQLIFYYPTHKNNDRNQNVPVIWLIFLHIKLSEKYLPVQ
jgi:hypothetical protein